MSAFFFGSSERPLYGFYHPPSRRPVRRTGVVLCPPFGQEYLRTHRTLRQMARRLADTGRHVLRFDYSGTGDSGGEGRKATLSAWEVDVGSAVEELEATGGVSRVDLIGVRLGAALAARVASARKDVEDLVLWDPVIRGGRYLEELRVAEEGRVPAGAAVGGRRSPPEDGAGDVVGAAGFPLGPELRRELAEVDLTTLSELPVRRVLLVVTEEKEEDEEMERSLGGLGPEVTRVHRPGSEGWENPGRMGTIVLVPSVVGTVVDFMEEGR